MGIAGEEKRRSGLELLRIIAMFLIVFGHFCGQSDVMRFIELHSATAVIVAILGNASRVSVNLFLIVAVWFMVGRDFKAERLIKTWVTVFLWGGGIDTCRMSLRCRTWNQGDFSVLSPDTRSPIMVCISIHDTVSVRSFFKYDFKMGKKTT